MISRFIRKTTFALWLMCLSSVAWADKYQDAVAKEFPGYQILSRSEFDQEIQEAVKGNPGLITGRFNDDELEDFAAIIRNDVKEKARTGEYYRGMVVVCHALDKERHTCETLTVIPIFLPYGLYLNRVGPRKVRGCLEGRGKETDVTIKRDAVGFRTLHTTAGAYIYQPSGSYVHCTTAD
jgi:hypothetical protein